MGRTETIRSLFNCQGKGLEIGPCHSPLFPKAHGFDVDILDYLDAEGLRRKYTGTGQDLSKIEEVDFISDGRPMTDIIGGRYIYDWIVASHVIEHVPDLIAFLNECEALLRPGGALVLAIPDKRCCFDILRPLSTVGQILQAHLEDRKRPWPGVIFDDVAYARRSGGRIGWSLGTSSDLQPVRPIEQAASLFHHAQDSTEYFDVHCWVFVPSSFELVINTLGAMQLIQLQIRSLRSDPGEILVVLSPSTETAQVDLGKLAWAAQAEEYLAHRDVDSLVPLAELVVARNQIKDMNQLISDLLNSASWRCTSPFRALKRLIRRTQR